MLSAGDGPSAALERVQGVPGRAGDGVGDGKGRGRIGREELDDGEAAGQLQGQVPRHASRPRRRSHRGPPSPSPSSSRKLMWCAQRSWAVWEDRGSSGLMSDKAARPQQLRRGVWC
eukprot:763876-Rhodomonas_salina.1